MSNPTQLSKDEYEASTRVTMSFSQLIENKTSWNDEIRATITSKKEAQNIRLERELKYKAISEDVVDSLAGRSRIAFEESCRRGNAGVLTTIPTDASGTAMPGLWWRANAQLRLGLPVTDLPAKCPDCGTRNSVEHALGGGKSGGCGGARNKRHDEVAHYLGSLTESAGFFTLKDREPLVPKLCSTDPSTRCDGIVRGLLTPQRETWIDIEVVDTGAVSHLTSKPSETLANAAAEKRAKHAPRLLATNRDFLPIICSVYGSTAFDCQQTIKTCTALTNGYKSDESDLSHLLHLNRAKFQAAVWRATALCLVGRRGKAQEKAIETHEANELKTADSVLPWLCVAADAGIRV